MIKALRRWTLLAGILELPPVQRLLVLTQLASGCSPPPEESRC
jgi:hypothetical protein